MIEPSKNENATSAYQTHSDAMQEDLVNLLVCPIDHARLDIEEQHLVCATCRRRYPIEDGVPNMLVDEP